MLKSYVGSTHYNTSGCIYTVVEAHSPVTQFTCSEQRTLEIIFTFCRNEKYYVNIFEYLIKLFNPRTLRNGIMSNYHRI